MTAPGARMLHRLPAAPGAARPSTWPRLRDHEVAPVMPWSHGSQREHLLERDGRVTQGFAEIDAYAAVIDFETGARLKGTEAGVVAWLARRWGWSAMEAQPVYEDAKRRRAATLAQRQEAT